MQETIVQCCLCIDDGLSRYQQTQKKDDLNRFFDSCDYDSQQQG